MNIIMERGISDERVEDVLSLLMLVDSEFVPPLSMRTSAFEVPLGKGGSVDAYVMSIRDLDVAYAYEDDILVGFCAWDTEHKLADVGLCAYIATSAVHPLWRGRGIVSVLYGRMLAFALDFGAPIAVCRTWSTNQSNLKALAKSGFYAFRRVPDERGLGVDTVWLKKLLRVV